MRKRRKSKWYYFVSDYAYREKITFEDAWNSKECRELYDKIFKSYLFMEADEVIYF